LEGQIEDFICANFDAKTEKKIDPSDSASRYSPIQLNRLSGENRRSADSGPPSKASKLGSQATAAGSTVPNSDHEQSESQTGCSRGGKGLVRLIFPPPLNFSWCSSQCLPAIMQDSRHESTLPS
jgi:hypothetical protein